MLGQLLARLLLPVPHFPPFPLPTPFTPCRVIKVPPLSSECNLLNFSVLAPPALSRCLTLASLGKAGGRQRMQTEREQVCVRVRVYVSECVSDSFTFSFWPNGDRDRVAVASVDFIIH